MFMKSFEHVYKELEDLFIQKLPGYIEKINKVHNDGILLKRFENRTLEEDCIKKPCFKFFLEESEYSEKDRIIENNIFSFRLELKLVSETNAKTIHFWRYVEAINKMLIEEYVNWENVAIVKVQETLIRLRIIT